MPLQFGSSGIRGKYGSAIAPSTAFELGKLLPKILGPRLTLARDPRLSGPVLKAAFLSSALQATAEITDYDLIPTPALAFQTAHEGCDGGVMITASHNPIEYNGFKIFNSKGESLEDSGVLSSEGPTTLSGGSLGIGVVRNGKPEGYTRMLATIQLTRKWRVVLDPGNGATSRLAPEIYRTNVGKATAINSDPDGTYPGRGPEPTRESVTLLSRIVSETKADIGIAFDGDGDRFYVVDENGYCPLQDRILASYLSFLAEQSKGPFMVPVDASMAVDEAVSKHGARIIRGPVGDAKLLVEMKKGGAIFAGEPSGAWIHGKFHPCPDGLLSGLLYMRELERSGLSVSEGVEMIPEYRILRKSVTVPVSIRDVDKEMFSDGLEKIIGTDPAVDWRFGVRVSSPDSWVLVRESGTEPVLRLTAESKNASDTDRIVRDTIDLINRVFRR